MPSSSLAAAKRNATRDTAEINSDYSLGKSRVNQDFRFTRSALDRALKNNVSENRNQFASQGLYNSGIRRGEDADIGTDYATNIGLTDQALSRELENLSRSRTKGLLGINTGLEGSLFGSTGESLSSILTRALNDAKARIK